jgi:putative transposase
MGRGPFHRLSGEALFRYGVVSVVKLCVQAGRTRAQAIAEVLDSGVADLGGGRGRAVSRRTIYRWLRAYERRGLEGLEPATRQRISDSKVLPVRLVDFLRAEKKADPPVSVPELIRRAGLRGIVDTRGKLSRTSVWRALRRMGLPTTRARRQAEADMRRFAHAHRMRLVLVDGKHFRAGAQRLKRVVLVFLDDATRYGLDLIVGPSESTELFLEGLNRTVRRFGLMVVLYSDHGSGFIAGDALEVVARLDVHFVHGRRRYPEGRGKVEAFNKTLKQGELRRLDSNPAVDPDCAALTLRLRHWLHGTYNHLPHEGLGGETPASRFEAAEQPLRYPADRAELDGAFVVTFERRVSKDNVISYGGQDYEVPRGRAGRRILVRRHLLDNNALSVVHDDREVRLHPVDLLDNATSARASAPAETPEPGTPPPTTAAQLAFEADFQPLVDDEGGYYSGDDDEDDNDPQ